MADPNLSRQLASSVIEALKQAGHVLIAKGKSETLLRELVTEIEPTLTKVLPRILRSEITGEVTSTFGDEATDEAVEELVEKLREQLIDSEGIEDVFADDKVIERVIFRTLHEGLVSSAHTAREEEEDAPPISVRLDQLGYVASTASKLTDAETLKDALERAALSASTELDTFDAGSRTAFFAASDDDPDKRLEIEEAVEEELADLVEMGLVDLPTSVRVVALDAVVTEERRKSLRKAINEMAARVLASRVCPGTWDWDGASAIKLTFTPMSVVDAKAVDGSVALFTKELAILLGAATATDDDVDEGDDDEPAPRSIGARSTPATSRLLEAILGAKFPPVSKSAGPKSAGPKSAGPKSGGPKSAGPKSAGPKSAGPKSAPAPKSSHKGGESVTSEPGTKPAAAKKSATKAAAAKAATGSKAGASKAGASKAGASKAGASKVGAGNSKSAKKKG